MKLRDMLEEVQIAKQHGDLNQEISGIAYDSRNVKPGDLFVCVEGFKTDGHQYIDKALAAGATALLCQKDIGMQPVPWVQTCDTRLGLSWVSAKFFDHPTRKLTLIGVTGTNGKTTVTHLVKQILEAKQHKVGLIGTIHCIIGKQAYEVHNTTPLPLELQEFFANMVAAHCNYGVMEVSSHALDMGRVADCEYDIAVFTNITQDHLDYHATMEDYLAAKARLFQELGSNNFKSHPKYGIINVDDAKGPYLVSQCPGPVLTYGIDNEADIRAKDIRITAAGVSFTVSYPQGSMQLNLKMTGKFSVYNALAAIAVGLVEKVEADLIKQALEASTGVAGRFELVNVGQDFGVVVDYAHTPDSLENILKTAKAFVKGKLITVFGCGGDRDRSKRPIMGRVAAQYSDYVVITSDNPRSENPEKILDDIEVGVKEVISDNKYAKIVNRYHGIEAGLEMAAKDDFVIIAGKGHETYQIIGDQVLDFDDREVARQILRSR